MPKEVIMANANHFDPADQEIGPELVNELKTDESMYTPDTNGDPVGSEERAKQEPRKLPDFYFAKYALDADGAPTFQQSRVDGIMKVFNAKKDTEMQFNNEDTELADKEREYFEKQVKTVADGFMPLLEVDPQSTGINLLQLTTRTWAEFSAIAYEYKEEAAKVSAEDELPTWLIEREDKMFGLGRKARMLSAVVQLQITRMSDHFLSFEVNQTTPIHHQLLSLLISQHIHLVNQFSYIIYQQPPYLMVY